MIVYPNAKINIGLRVLSKRADGFHNIETCFYPLSLSDILEFVDTSGELEFTSSGISIPGESEDNICMKAWKLMHDAYNIPPVKIHLHKVIPIGAGLGGGSADGAYMLKALSDYFNLNIENSKLFELAGRLGSDCSFFLLNLPAIGVGRGEILESVKLNLDDYKIVLINPGIHVSTALAYSGVVPQQPESKLEDLLKHPVELWGDSISNDFESGVFKKFPEILDVKNQLKELGASYTAMSGSGSSVFGLFKEDIPRSIKELFKEYFVYFEE